VDKQTLSKKYMVVKSNRLNEFHPMELKSQELRFLNIYLAKINPVDINSRRVKVLLDDFRTIMGFDRIDTKKLRQVMDGLLMKITEIPHEDGKGFIRFQLFKECEVIQDEDGEWHIIFDAHDRALPLMFDLRSHYFKYELWNTLSLTGHNQLRMYEILKQYEKTGYRIIGVNELRDMLGILPKEYPVYNDFKKRVLDACQRSLSEKTDISFTYEVDKRAGRGGKIQSLKFIIAKNENYKSPLNLEKFLNLVKNRQDLDKYEYVETHKGSTGPAEEKVTGTFPSPPLETASSEPIQSLTEIEHFANFETFWHLYPKKKIGKKTAMDVWFQLPRNSSLFNEIITGLEKAKKSQDWANDDGRYILAPTRWLKEERWGDDFNEYTYGNKKQRNRFQNYTGRKWDYADLERMQQDYLDRKLLDDE
jgi:hypothetical protein